MIKRRFQTGGQMTKELLQLIQAFMLDLGIVLGAKNEKEALQTGQAAVQKLGKDAGKLFQAWGLAESQQQGAGRQVIAEALGGDLKLAAQSLKVGSMTSTYNAPPTSTAYGDDPNAAIKAKKGAKLQQLNGKCPEGFEVEKYLVGGCVKCRKKKQLALAEELKCGGKKRISKAQNGEELPELKCGKRIKKHFGGGSMGGSWAEAGATMVNGLADMATNLAQIKALKQFMKQQAELEKQKLAQQQAMINGQIQAQRDAIQAQKDANFQSKMALTPTAFQAQPTMQPYMMQPQMVPAMYPQRMYKKGGDLTKSHMEALKYSGGPGDIDSTQGMKPNKKQKAMLPNKKRFGGKVNGADKITISLPVNTFDVIHR